MKGWKKLKMITMKQPENDLEVLILPGGTYRQLPLLLTTIFVWYVPSNPSSALL